MARDSRIAHAGDVAEQAQRLTDALAEAENRCASVEREPDPDIVVRGLCDAARVLTAAVREVAPK